MSSQTYTLHAPPGSFRAFKPLIAAEYNSIPISVPDFDANVAKSLSPTGKAPVLQTSSGVIFESNAMARHVARLRRDTCLTGKTVFEEAEVDAWVDFGANEVEIPACVWFYPVAGYMPFHADAYNKAKSDLAKALGVLDNYLLTKTYLVGEQITLADICLVSALVYPMKLVCDKAYLKPFGNVTRWFNTCVNQPAFKAVIGEVTLCKKELTAPGQSEAPAAKKGGDKGGKKGGKKEKKAEEAKEAPPPAPKKVEHPYKIMDREKPSPFNMDAWKKTYSNATSFDEAMKYFWEKFDAEGYSLWYQNYNYNDENKRIFMTANAVGGFQQRSEEVRKWAFGVMDVLGTEETVLEIKGVWLLRGDTVDHMKEANDDANWYTWKKLGGPGMPISDEDKEVVRSFWCEENELEGKPIQDSKVFK